MTYDQIRPSVIIPVFNKPRELENCLEALVKQNNSPAFEVIVVDDGSTENLSKVKEKFAARLNLRWCKLEKNQGPAVARNAGIKMARGNVVVFTDSDCQPDLNWLKRMTAPFCDPEITGVKGSYKTRQVDTWAKLAQIEFEERFDLLEQSLDIDFVDTYSGAFKRADLIKIGGFDTSFTKADNEDVDLAFRIKLMGGHFVFVRDAFVEHKHREGFWNYFKLKFFRGFWRSKVYEKHPGKMGKESYTPNSLKMQLVLLLIFPFIFLFSSKKVKSIIHFIIFWLISCGNLLKVSFRFHRDVLYLVPVFAFFRGVALLGGLAWAEIISIRKKVVFKLNFVHRKLFGN
ncbi:MAG: glycosyltransferase [Candidatus Riflebacteria bacterium]|nr:glycosyltransferase [Candidatus Riflebacteria bacterium]